MRIEKGNHDEEEYGDDEFGPKRDCPSSNTTLHKDAKNSDKAVMRSKHSVTEQRRRSKINERFQVLRELIPHGEQKRDTASFLTEVIEYVQYLQEKLQKYEGSYPGWTPEPTKLMPWRNSHWRVQGFVNHLQSINNGSGPPGTPFPATFEENNMTNTPEVVPGALIRVESDADRDEICGSMDRQLELDSKGLSLAMSVASIPQDDHQSNESPARIDVSGQTEDQVIEGGTINISSVYSNELLNSLTQALQKAGIDLSHARLSVRIDLGKRSNQGVTSSKDPVSDNEGIMQPKEEYDHSHKRMKT